MTETPDSAARPFPVRPRTAAIRRSLAIYHRDAEHGQRMDALYRRFVSPGMTVFDIGAHVGDRVGSFLRLGANVVAAEPQPDPHRALRLLYGRCDRVRLVSAAVGAKAGTAAMHLNTANPTVSTLAPDFVAAAQGAKGWDSQRWDGRIDVPVTTLDALIAEHGAPGFIKIDVEGHEAAVLRGLNKPVPALSFEFTTIQRDVAQTCINLLTALGPYRFNLSLGETHRLSLADWCDGETLARTLLSLPAEANSGDIYARLRPGV